MKTISHIIYAAFALFTFACFALLQNAQAVVPPPDGGYANQNTAEGDDALFSLTIGKENTAIGFEALYSNTTGDSNTATGFLALLSNTTGVNNTAIGTQALVSNTTGVSSAATGAGALASNTTGSENTATGAFALYINTEGSTNTANGFAALNTNTTGSYNTATGHQALFSNTTGSNNIAVGYNAGSNLTTGSNNIDIGNLGVAGEANTIRIGTQGTQRKAFIAGISATAVSGRQVMVSSTGQLGVAPSSVRFKEEIKQMDRASEAILALKPVSFRYKKEIDPTRTAQFGLVSEEVEKVNPDLVVRDADGKAFTVRYDAVNAMLLNEFLKEHRTVQEMKKEIAVLTATVKEQALQIQKVSAELQMQRPALQRVANNQ
jgi:hypothetical protein